MTESETTCLNYLRVSSSHDRTNEWRLCCLDILTGKEPSRRRFRAEDTPDFNFTDDNDEDYDDHLLPSCFSPPDTLAIDMADTSARSLSHGDIPLETNNVVGSNVDSWVAAALALSASIDEVSLMICLKATSYVSSADTINACFQDENSMSGQNSMTDADRSILETTVASFVAGMAKQIESLRQTVAVEGDHPFLKASETANYNNDKKLEKNIPHSWSTGPIGHRAGIASCLMQRLKTCIMDPMTFLQIERERMKSSSQSNYFSGREASKIVQNPLRGFCVNVEDTLQRNVPPAPWEEQELCHSGHGWPKDAKDQEKDEFLNIYFEHKEFYVKDSTKTSSSDILEMQTVPPPSVFQFLRDKTQEQHIEHKLKRKSSSKINQPQPKPHNELFPANEAYESSYVEDENFEQLQRESATLLATYQQSDLEGVQKVERSMVEITQLLSRFTDLISEQQEDIFLIHDHALKSKENVDKGQDQLVDAATRGEKSKHPMASFIAVMALLLLVFNWITP